MSTSSSAKRPVTKLLVIKNCMQCPNCFNERTPGSRFAVDYKCRAADGKIIARYVEWPGEEPKDNEFPSFCPLTTDKRRSKK